jgi:hypothetical protein
VGIMRRLLPVCVGLVVLLGIVSGVLWYQLRAERQFNSDLQAAMAREKTSCPDTARNPAPQRMTEGMPTAEAGVGAPGNPVVNVETPRITGNYQQSDMTANARVNVWLVSLAAGGLELTRAQAQALRLVAVAELRRETDESAVLARRPKPTDAEGIARAEKDFIVRQNNTNLRILDAVAPQLSVQQLKGLRTQFEAWFAGAQASAGKAP